jgi:ABC-type multidrug transport system ATPase subunit
VVCAGKTTLLDVLASYKTVGRVQGRIVTSKEVKRWCYVTQDDVHLATLTVRETLQFAALLRIEEGVSGPPVLII